MFRGPDHIAIRTVIYVLKLRKKREGRNSMATSTHDASFDERNETIKIYVNGTIVPRHEAKVSVYDSGFMLGDGV